MSAVPRHLEVIYCDDIRHEIGNKSSYMGIYALDLYMPSIPAVLPKFCIAIKAVTEITDPFEALEIRILKVKGDEETEILSSGPVAIPETPKEFQAANLMNMQFTFILAPFQIDEEFLLRVRAKTEREELRASGLSFRRAPTSESNSVN